MANRKLHLDDLRPGDVAVVGYRGHRWTSVFQGFVLEDGKPRAQFLDVSDDVANVIAWDAYLFEGAFCVGSSADKLIVHSVAPPRPKLCPVCEDPACENPGHG